VRWQLNKRLLVGFLISIGVLAPAIFVNRAQVRAFVGHLPVVRQALQKKTIDEQISQYGSVARQRLFQRFRDRGVSYPPDRVTLVAIKDQRELQVYAAADPTDGSEPQYTHIWTYPIEGASGNLGPKLREGDRQVPEGLYLIESLEPNTPYHLGLRVNYPNVFDLARAHEDGRTKPGSDILIHGSNCSIGCLAMGDEASEDLFVLIHDSREDKEPLIIAPVDFRKETLAANKPEDPSWLAGLYEDIKQSLGKYPLPSSQKLN
jgi:murein L,D-transpeptidase YafK